MYYSWGWPYFSNLSFLSNEAIYGKDIGSFPIKYWMNDWEVKSITLEEVASGQKYDEVITVELLDYDGQIYNIDSDSTVEIMAADVNSQLKMIYESVVKLNSGVAKFSNLGFIGTPKSTGNEFFIRSQIISPT